MRYLSTKTGLAMIAIASAAVVSACSSYTVPARTYYLDASCQYYYVDSMGQKVYEGKYMDSEFLGLTLQHDANGRWFYQDSVGNRVYQSKRC